MVTTQFADRAQELAGRWGVGLRSNCANRPAPPEILTEWADLMLARLLRCADEANGREREPLRIQRICPTYNGAAGIDAGNDCFARVWVGPVDRRDYASDIIVNKSVCKRRTS